MNKLLVILTFFLLGLSSCGDKSNNKWKDIVKAPPAKDEAIVVELYAKKFDWTARYSGADNKLGHADYKLVDEFNSLGVMTTETVKYKLAKLDDEIERLTSEINDSATVQSTAKMLKKENELVKLEKIKSSLLTLAKSKMDKMDAINKLAYDDFIVKDELYLKVNQEYYFIFRSQDVIHSAYFPHFRMQMNSVPGMSTSIKFKPTKTTAEMRKENNDEDFDYVLLCNNICGEGHAKMQMKVVVVEEKRYDNWVANQRLFEETLGALKEEMVHGKPIKEKGLNDNILKK